jgi:hypothetical protein
MSSLDEEMPPWLSLPKGVRQRVSERMGQRYGREDDQEEERHRQELRDLSAYRLVGFYGLKKAMRKGREYPGFGKDPRDWEAAVERCRALMGRMRTDPLFMERVMWLKEAVKEEMAKEEG